MLGHGLLIELDVRLCEEVVVGLICVGDGLVSGRHLLGLSAQGIYYLTSGKLKGRRNCLRIMMNERRKVKMMKRFRESERTLNSCMRHGVDHGMERGAHANILSHCTMCKK